MPRPRYKETICEFTDKMINDKMFIRSFVNDSTLTKYFISLGTFEELNKVLLTTKEI